MYKHADVYVYVYIYIYTHIYKYVHTYKCIHKSSSLIFISPIRSWIFIIKTSAESWARLYRRMVIVHAPGLTCP